MPDETSLLQPHPRRIFDLSNNDPDPIPPSTPNGTSTGSSSSDLTPPTEHDVSRTGSVTNLTSPTLVGIYSPTTAQESPREESDNPFGVQGEEEDSTVPEKEETPMEEDAAAASEGRRLNRGLFRGTIVPRTVQSALLFIFGVAYGVITMHLHENHWITPVKLGKVQRHSWQYLTYWGFGGVAIGNVLPWLDSVSSLNSKRVLRNEKRNLLSWDAAVRSAGAFVGIAFAFVRGAHVFSFFFLQMTIYDANGFIHPSI